MKNKNKRIKRRAEISSLFDLNSLSYILFALGFVVYLIARQISGVLSYLDISLPYVSEVILRIALYCLAFGLYGLAAFSGFSTKQKNQPIRDKKIASSGPYALFLRTFISDKFSLPNPFVNSWLGVYNTEPMALGPEELIGRVLEPYINVRQISGNIDTIGNSRVYTSNSEWKNTFIHQLNGASIIIILPGVLEPVKNVYSGGLATLWELEQLVKTKRIRETVVMMLLSNWFNNRKISSSWENVRLLARSFSLLLPEYDSRGAFMTFTKRDESWCVDQIHYTSLFRRKRISKSLICAIKDLEANNNREYLVYRS